MYALGVHALQDDVAMAETGHAESPPGDDTKVLHCFNLKPNWTMWNLPSRRFFKHMFSLTCIRAQCSIPVQRQWALPAGGQGGTYTLCICDSDRRHGSTKDIQGTIAATHFLHVYFTTAKGLD